jgi:hypothetical protein
MARFFNKYSLKLHLAYKLIISYTNKYSIKKNVSLENF